MGSKKSKRKKRGSSEINSKIIIPPWAVTDETAMDLVPPQGFLHDYINYASESTDAPIWFHMGSILTTIACALGFTDIEVHRADGKSKTFNMQMWSAIVAQSQDRKSAAANIATRVLRKARPSSFMANEGSVDGWFEGLLDDDVGGVQLIHRDELVTLWDSQRKSYNNNFSNWLLQTYNDGFLTKQLTSKQDGSGGFVQVPRARISVLGNIPPDVLQRNTSRGDWRSGFLPRFYWWPSVRVRYMELDGYDPKIEAQFARWLKKVCCRSVGKIIFTYEVSRLITNWVLRNVERRRHRLSADEYPIMVKLMDKAFTIAAIFAAANRRRNFEELVVRSKHVRRTLRMIDVIRDSTRNIFSVVSIDQATAEEESILNFLEQSPGASVHAICTSCGLSRQRAKAILDMLFKEETIEPFESAKKVRGRPGTRYQIR